MIAVVMLAGAWTLGALNASYFQQAEQAAEKYARDADQRIADTCLYRPGYVECANEIIKTSQEAQTAQKDLAAQRGMELWAMSMFWAAVASVIATSIGIVLVWLNLQEARIVSAEATKSSNAAVRMAEAMVGIELPIIQPRWGGTEVGATDALVTGGQPYACTILDRPTAESFLVIDEIRFRNFGRTVAIPTRLEVGFNFCDELPPFPGYHTGVSFEGTEVIRPEPQEDAFRAGVEMGIHLSEETCNAWVSGTVVLWIYCALTYRDFMGNPHTKRFCARWHHRSDGGGAYYFASDGNPPDSYTN